MPIAAEEAIVDHPEPATHPSTKFNCCECGRLVRRLIAPDVGELRLCAACLMNPGWFRDPVKRSIVDPDHDGLEVCERSIRDADQ